MNLIIKTVIHEISDLNVSWVGECPWTNTLCVGGEDGKVLFLPADPSGEAVNITSIQLATDAINAVAFADDLIATSSRNEVQVAKIADDRGLNLLTHSFTGGAHGVVASRAGEFLAPIGDQGLLILNPDNPWRIDAKVACFRNIPFNCYKLVRLGNDIQEEAFAAAGRRDGLVALSFANGMFCTPMIHHHFEGHDIVDVCSLNDPYYPLAVACVSRNRAIFLIRNVLEDKTPFGLSVEGLRGIAYTLLSAQGHLFLLTDEQLITLPNVASRFLRGESFDRPLEIVNSPVNAAEAFLWRDQSVLLIEEDSTVAELRVAAIVGHLAERRVGTEPAGNGQIGQEGSIIVTSELRTPIPIESGWRTNQFELTLVSAA
jgi:hypothetical protein